MRQDRAVEQITQAGLIKAVHVGVTQHVFARAVRHVHVALQDHVVLRQGARLVRAEHVHRPEVLNGMEVLHDDLLSRHHQRALREAHRHDHWQHLRRETYRHGQGKEQRLHPVPLGQPNDEKSEGNHHHHETDHEPGEVIDALVEARGHALREELLGHRAEVGSRAGLEHHAPGRAAKDVAAHEARISELERNASHGLIGLRVFFNRHRLARERRLGDEEILGGQNAEVGRDQAPGGQDHDVSGHNVLE